MKKDYAETKEKLCEGLGLPKDMDSLIELRRHFDGLKEHYQSPLGMFTENLAIAFGRLAISKDYIGTYEGQEADFRRLAEIILSKNLSNGMENGNFIDYMA